MIDYIIWVVKFLLKPYLCILKNECELSFYKYVEMLTISCYLKMFIVNTVLCKFLFKALTASPKMSSFAFCQVYLSSLSHVSFLMVQMMFINILTNNTKNLQTMGEISTRSLLLTMFPCYLQVLVMDTPESQGKKKKKKNYIYFFPWLS